MASDPKVQPYLYYEDVAAALEWLTRAFGFQERLRVPAEDGSVNHAEMVHDGGVILLGDPGSEYRNPKRTGVQLHGTVIYVDDVNAHCERARQAGATITMEPRDREFGERMYGAEDPEGHRWYFSQRLGPRQS